MSVFFLLWLDDCKEGGSSLRLRPDTSRPRVWENRAVRGKEGGGTWGLMPQAGGVKLHVAERKLQA